MVAEALDTLPRTPSVLSVHVGRPHKVAWQGRTVYTGVFEAPVPGSPPTPPAGRSPGNRTLVSFARSGISTRFVTGCQSVLEHVDACDISTRWSCRTGVRHTCTTPLAPLEAPAEGEVLISCARPDTDVVLDMRADLGCRCGEAE